MTARSYPVKLRHLFYHALQGPHERTALTRLHQLERQLPAPHTRLAIPFLFRGAGFFKSIQPMQSQFEIGELYQVVSERQPEVVVEIGTCHGGTLYLWCQAAHPRATLVSIDLPEGEFGGGYRDCRAGFYGAFAGPQQSLHLLRANSHLPETVEKVKEFTGNRPVDFLFIDGDHTYTGVKQDFELFSPLVGKRGLIALHDIAPRDNQPRIEVWKFWQEVKQQHPDAREFIDCSANGRKIGIGLIEWRR